VPDALRQAEPATAIAAPAAPASDPHVAVMTVAYSPAPRP
jgi:hypothetical protein